MNIGTSAIQANSNVESLPGSASANAPVRTQPAAQKEDSVQLSDTAQKAVATASAAATTTRPTIDQIIKLAANGDIAALAQLILV